MIKRFNRHTAYAAVAAIGFTAAVVLAGCSNQTPAQQAAGLTAAQNSAVCLLDETGAVFAALPTSGSNFTKGLAAAGAAVPGLQAGACPAAVAGAIAALPAAMAAPAPVPASK